MKWKNMKLQVGIFFPYPSFMFKPCNLLIDCSSIISRECELFNFHVTNIIFICIISTWNTIYNFNCLQIKTLDLSWNHMKKIFQRVFDYLLIRRYRVNIADTLGSSSYFYVYRWTWRKSCSSWKLKKYFLKWSKIFFSFQNLIF